MTDNNRREDEEEVVGTSWDGDDAEGVPVKKIPNLRRLMQRKATATSTRLDDKIERHLRTKSKDELADLIRTLTRRFPAINQALREQIALQEGDADRLLAEARDAIRRLMPEPAWQNRRGREGHRPNYGGIQRHLERVLELGRADEVVPLGREFIEQGLRQLAESDYESEATTAFTGCLSVVFQAVARSSLSGPERLLFAIDANLADHYDLIATASAAILDAPPEPGAWSVVADALAERLKAGRGRETDTDTLPQDYQHKRITDWIAKALSRAGRAKELRTIYESEAQATGSYERLVEHLLETRCFEDAERWAREGIAATAAKSPGIAEHLAGSLCELAQKRKQWDVVGAHAARAFFEHPSVATFDELVRAAKKAKVEGPVRGAALRFLETGARPFQLISQPPAAVTSPRSKPSAKQRPAKGRPTASAAEPKAGIPDRLKIDPAWPLPMPDDLIPLLNRPGRYDSAPRPHLHVLLDMAIAAKRPDEVLRWFDKMRSGPQRYGSSHGPLAYTNRVAAAVSTAYPERSIEIYLAAINAELPHAQQSAYETVTDFLKKLRPIYEALGRSSEWTTQIASIRERYRNRPRLMELLDQLDGRTVVQSTRAKRK